jgi:hypothetical protein
VVVIRRTWSTALLVAMTNVNMHIEHLPCRNEISKTQRKEIQGSFIQPELLSLNAARRIASKQRSRNTYIPDF